MKSTVYYESIKRELNRRLIFDSRCDARQSLEIQRREKVKRGEKNTFSFFLYPLQLKLRRAKPNKAETNEGKGENYDGVVWRVSANHRGTRSASMSDWE